MPPEELTAGAVTADVAVRALSVAGALAGAASADEVAAVVLHQALALVGAAGVNLSLLNLEGRELVTTASAGYAPELIQRFQTYPLDAALPASDAVRSGEGVWLNSAAVRDRLYPHLAGLAPEHAAWAIVPLRSRGAAIGAMSFAFVEERSFDLPERALIEALVAQCASALERVRAEGAEREAREALERESAWKSFLLEAGRRLAESLDPHVTLREITALAVPGLADWAAVYMAGVQPIVPTAVAHADEGKVALLYDYLRRYPVKLDGPSGLAAVLREGGTEYVPEASEELLAAFIADEEQRALVRQLELRSAVTVPMTARGRVVGALSMASATPNRHGQEDVRFLQELGARAGLAIDNARLFQEVRALNADLEARVDERTSEVLTRVRALEAFAELTEAVGSGASLPDLVRAALTALVRAVSGADAAYLVPDGGLWRAVDWAGEPDAAALAALQAGLRPGAPSVRVAAGDGRPVFFDHYGGLEDGLPEVARVYPAVGAIPVISGGEARGIFAVGLRDRIVWPEREKAVVRAVGHAYSLALERARLVESLEAQNRELAEKTAEQETFLYTVSHDLRAPLLSIAGMSAVLRESVAQGDAAESVFLLERVERNVSHMERLLSDLLAFSRIGRAHEDVAVCDLEAALADALRLLEPLVRSRGARVELPAGCGTVLYPPSELQQVLVNLLSNALKWAGALGSEPRVAVECRREGRHLWLAVGDNGPGIEPRLRERVWRLFQRLDAKVEGTGVGLAIVKRSVERHGGEASIGESPLGGAEFTVLLPAAG